MTVEDVAHIPLAIVGMACRLPGADNLDEYWDLLVGGESDLGELPPERFNRELYYDPRKGVRTKSYTSLGGLVSNRPFDARSCPLPQELIESSHEAHLRLCEVAAAACRHAGWDPFQLPSRQMGVYVGHTPPSALSGNLLYARQIAETAQYLREIEGFDQLTGGQQESIIRELIDTARAEFPPGDVRFKLRSNAFHAAALITRGFNLDGPSMSFDAACASSLRALGHAARAIQLGQIDSAIVGGASLCHRDTLVLFSQAQSLSPTGSRPFDKNADGLVAAEGYIAVVVKRLDRALADNDRVLAVIRGIGIASDGKGKSLWAPRKEGQIEAIRRAYGRDISVADLQYIEMHATSTQVGDATEMSALTEVLAGELPQGRKIPVGSVKANVGHTLESAGLASLVKTVLSMQHGIIPPQINIEHINDKIAWDEIPFHVPQTGLRWDPPEPGKPRRAAINAFGIGGLNVHVVLDEFASSAEFAEAAGRSPQSSAAGQIDSESIRAAAQEPIAIIGMGAVFPGARTIEALFDLLRTGESQIRDLPEEEWTRYVDIEAERMWRIPIRRAGFVHDFQYDWKKHRVPPKQVADANPLQFMLLDAADQAFHDAGLDQKSFDKLRTGAIVGTIFGGDFTDQLTMGLNLPVFQQSLAEALCKRGVPEESIAQVARQYENILLSNMPALIDESGSFTCSTLASRLTKTFDLMGGAVAVDAGDASAMAALAASIDLLRAGDCDMMLCAAGQRAMGSATYAFMASNGQLASDATGSPLGADSHGAIPGECTGVVILKRLSDAQRDGDNIRGIIHGVGVARDESLDTSLRLAIDRALKSSRVDPSQVALVETGAVGIPGFDDFEIEAIAGSYNKRDQSLILSSASAQFGYAGGGTGIASLFKAVAELNDTAVPGLRGFENPAPRIAQHSQTLRLAAQKSPLPALNEDGRMLAGVDSFSQFHMAYHLVVEGATRVAKKPAAVPETSVPATPQPVSAARWRTVRIGAPSIAQLVSGLAAVAEQAATLLDEADLQCFAPADRCRLAIVTDSTEDLQEKLTLAAKQLERTEARPLLAEKGIIYGERADSRPRVAFLFPGQGSQHAGMLKTLVEEYAPAAAAMHQVDAVLRSLGVPTFAEMAWQNGDTLGTDIWATQLSLLAADTIVYQSAKAMGLRPDRVAGHSFGELVALTAAGSWTFEQAVRATKERCAAIVGCKNSNGIMLSTSAPSEVMEELCRKIGGVHVSHRNAPDQTVAGGEEEPVNRLAAEVQSLGYQARLLEVPAAFHTPLMEEVKVPFGRGLADIPLEPPSIPLISSVTNRYVAEPSEIRDNLVVQMTQPVNYSDLAARLADEGVSLFVEVGPKQVLTGLHKRIFGDRPLTLISCDHKVRGGLQQLLCVRATLEVAGALDLQVDEIAGTISVPADASQTPPAAEEQSAAAVPQTSAQTTESGKIEKFNGLNVLRLNGTPYEMGLQQGQAQSDRIRKVLRRYADQAGSRWDRLYDIDAAVARAEQFFTAAELEEIRGIAKGAGVTVESIVAHNLRLYLDAGAGGLHFAVTAGSNPAGGLLHAANEDLQRGLSVRDCLERNIQVRRPQDGIAHVAFGVAGQVGCLNGINAAGVAVSTTALLDRPKTDASSSALLHTVLVKHLLERAESIETALDIVGNASKRGAWSLCLSHAASDRLSYVEFDGTNLRVQSSPPSIISANHRLLETAAGETQPRSQQRLERLKSLLGGAQPQQVTPDRAQQILRDRFDESRGRELDSPNLNTIRRVDNQISIVMQPATGDLWVTPGPLTNGQQNDFQHLRLDELLGDGASSSTSPESASELQQSSTIEQSQSPQTIIDAQQLNRSYAVGGANVGDSVCCRYVMRVVPAPLAATSPLRQFAGPAFILGRNAFSAALREKLEQRGVAVHELPVSDDIESVFAALDQQFQQQPVPHLFICTAFDDGAETSLDRERWAERRRDGVMLPYRVCQKWFELVSAHELLDRATLVAATSLGGDFGFAGNVANVESGALAGLVKGVRLELEIGKNVKNFPAIVVDADKTTAPAALAEHMVRETQSNTGESEVGYINGQRHVVRPVVEPLGESSLADIPPGAHFVITGGARGVTAVVARELGKRHGAKLSLIGSSPAPEIPEKYRDLADDELKELRGTIMKEALADGQKPVDAWARFEKALEIDGTLQSLAAEGIDARYYSCDISDRNALASLLDEIRAAAGPIDGVIHGAGFERASRFEKKQIELVDRTIAAKVDGAAALMELTANDPMKYFAAFGSVSGRFGGVGQTDYCAANDMLAKLVDWYRRQRPSCPTTLFHWHAWDDVGMAVRPESQHIRKLHKINFMPSLEGADHLIDELRAGLPEGEIVITEYEYCRQKYASAAATSDAETSTSMLDAIPEHQSGTNLIAEVHLDPTADLFLAQHTFKGRPLMPVVATLEAMAQAASALTGQPVTGLRGIEIQNGLRFLTDNPQTARVHAEQNGSEVTTRFTCDFYNRRGQLLLADKPYLQCVAETGDVVPLSAAQPRQPAEWATCWYPDEDIVIWHGPAYRCLNEIAVEGEEAWGRIKAPQPDELAGRRGPGWLLPAATLDSCFFACGIFLWWRFRGVVAIPDGLEHLRLGRHPRADEQCLVHIRDRGRNGKRALYDFTVFGDDGSVLFQVDGYRNVIVAEETAHAV